MKFSKTVNNKKYVHKMIFFNEKYHFRGTLFVIHIFWKLPFSKHFTFKIDVQFLMTFTQLTARLKNFLRGWLLISSLKEGMVECGTVFAKSKVILSMAWFDQIQQSARKSTELSTFCLQVRKPNQGQSLMSKVMF